MYNIYDISLFTSGIHYALHTLILNMLYILYVLYILNILSIILNINQSSKIDEIKSKRLLKKALLFNNLPHSDYSQHSLNFCSSSNVTNISNLSSSDLLFINFFSSSTVISNSPLSFFLISFFNIFSPFYTLLKLCPF